METLRKARKAKSSLDDDKFRVPCNEDDWMDLEDKERLRGTIHDLEVMKSGSDITVEQFLLLCAYWPRLCEPAELERCKDMYGLDKTWDDARRVLDSSRSFENFKAAIRNQQSVASIHELDTNWLGAFTPAKRFQDHIIETNPSAKRPAELMPAAQQPSRQRLRSGKRSMASTEIFHKTPDQPPGQSAQRPDD
jgi:hypothetical protein